MERLWQVCRGVMFDMLNASGETTEIVRLGTICRLQRAVEKCARMAASAVETIAGKKKNTKPIIGVTL